MTNLGEIATPFKCISYYVSTKSSVDNQHSYCYWFRGKLIRIVSKKPFARGDMLIVNSIETQNNGGIVINVDVDAGEYQKLPVLSFVSTRLVYNKYSDFEFTSTPGVTIIKTIEQVMDDNYSACFIVLSETSGMIHAIDKHMNNYFDINISLGWSE